jgi:hypothetical protein
MAVLTAGFYIVATTYYMNCVGDYKKAHNFCNCALILASECNSSVLRIGALGNLVTLTSNQGDCVEGLQLAHKAHRIAVAIGDIWGELNRF